MAHIKNCLWRNVSTKCKPVLVALYKLQLYLFTFQTLCVCVISFIFYLCLFFKKTIFPKFTYLFQCSHSFISSHSPHLPPPQHPVLTDTLKLIAANIFFHYVHLK